MPIFRFVLINFCLLIATFSQLANAQISPLDIDLGESYYYTDHYEVVIDSSVAEVWPFVVDLRSWMGGQGDATKSSPLGIEGNVFRIYGDFYVEIVKVIPEQMLLLVNLPNTQDKEVTQGIAMITAREVNGETIVSLFMSRVYLWAESEENTLRKRRESSSHSINRKSMYNNFLTKLKVLVEKAK